MKTLIRFEPCINEYVVMDEGQFYTISPEDISELLDSLQNYKIVKNFDHPPNIYSMPLRVQLQVTNKCNLRCITCAVAEDDNKNNPIMSSEGLKKLLKSLSNHGILNVAWSGGEPLVRKDFWQIVEYAVKLGLSQNLLTNGTLFTDDNIKIIKNNFFRVQVSLDAIGETYNQIVNKDIWSRFVKSIRLAMNSGVNNIVAATVLQKDNVTEIGSIIDFCSKENIKKIRISMRVPIGRSKSLTWEEYSSVIEVFRQQWPQLKEYALQRNVEIDCFLEKVRCFDESLPDVSYIVSPGGFTILYIDAYGDVYPFPFLTSSNLKLGTIKSDNLREIWLNSTILQKLRRLTYKNIGCGDCRLECAFTERSVVYAFLGKLEGSALSHAECQQSRE